MLRQGNVKNNCCLWSLIPLLDLKINKLKNNIQVNKYLAEKYRLPNGKLTAVFVKNKGNYRNFDCLLCSMQNLPAGNVVSHAAGKKHKDIVKSSQRTRTPDHASSRREGKLRNIHNSPRS